MGNNFWQGAVAMNTESKIEKADKWEPFLYFLGQWKGVGSGNPGESQVEREYKLSLKTQFIQICDRSVYKPQEKNPQGEVHEEIGFLSFDQNRQKYILREFHVEGYVNQYVLEESDQNTLVFKTEAIENIPPGWQARTTYEILGENQFRETFDLAGPNQDWTCYITNDLFRVAKE
jgi:hypothetical protein